MSNQKYTPEQIVAALNETGGMRFLAARRLGCSVKTIDRAKKNHAAVREACEQKKGEMVDAAESALLRAVLAGEAWAVCFCLKTQAKDRGYVERQEVRQIPDEDLDAAIERELARVAGRGQAAPPGPPEGGKSVDAPNGASNGRVHE